MDNEEEKKKIEYFDMSDAMDDLRYSFGKKEKAKAGLKLFGKGAVNLAKWAALDLLPEMSKRVEEEKKKR